MSECHGSRYKIAKQASTTAFLFTTFIFLPNFCLMSFIQLVFWWFSVDIWSYTSRGAKGVDNHTNYQHDSHVVYMSKCILVLLHIRAVYTLMQLSVFLHLWPECVVYYLETGRYGKCLILVIPVTQYCVTQQVRSLLITPVNLLPHKQQQ